MTSNRDEKQKRPKAIPSKNYRLNNKNVFFPRDPKAGGTWYAVDEYSNIIVLLNGARIKHKYLDKYQKSRGLIVVELISSYSITTKWETIGLEAVEPFTLVVYEKEKLYQLQWNGVQKKLEVLDDTQPYIWSSVTLYSEEIRQKRKERFTNFLIHSGDVNAEKLIDFHSFKDSKNNDNDFIINRNNDMLTLSITQTILEQNKVSIEYHDLAAIKIYKHSFIVI